MAQIKVEIPENTWTLAAENVTTGLIEIKEWQPETYYKTYVMTGDPAPIGNNNIDTSTVVRDYQMPISASAAIDVYLYCLDHDGAVVVSL